MLSSVGEIEALDPSAEIYLENFISKKLSYKLFDKEYPIKAHYKYTNTESYLYQKLLEGGFILTTAPLYAMAKSKKYNIFLTPDNIKSIISQFVKNDINNEILTKLYQRGIHNVLIINRGVEDVAENSEVSKLSTICLLTSDYISKHPDDFANFIESKWKENPINSDIELNAEAILDSIKSSYNFSNFDNYFNNYCIESSLEYCQEDSTVFATVYKAINSNTQMINLFKDEIDKLLEENLNEIETSRKLEIETAVKEFDFYRAVGEFDKCKQLKVFVFNRLNELRA